MKKQFNILAIIALFVSVLVISACGGSGKAADENSEANKESTENKSNDNAEANNVSTGNKSKQEIIESPEYKRALEIQDSLGVPELKHEVDLNDDNQKEIFICNDVYSRGASFALFTIKDNTYKVISKYVSGSHNEIEVLKTTNKGWHDFKTMQASGRDGMIEMTYTFNGSEYVEKSSEEIPLEKYTN